MKKLINFSVDPWDLDKFGSDESRIRAFLSKHRIDGMEMIQYADWHENGTVPSDLIIGNHTCFWPIWLDFWRDDQKELIRQFGNEHAYKTYYGCNGKEEFVDYYRRELKKAVHSGAEYVVFHVSHSQIEHCYSFEYSYDDEEVASAFIEMMNEILDGLPPSIEILFENHWYPGLTYLDKAILSRIMKEVLYPRKGFVLDIGHLMNTNLDLKSEEEAVGYMLSILQKIEGHLSDIKVIHLNSSLSGAYIKNEIAKERAFDASKDFNQRYIDLYGHIAQIDTHKPFEDPLIRKVLELVSPEYLVYEFSAETLETLDAFIELQNKVLNM